MKKLFCILALALALPVSTAAQTATLDVPVQLSVPTAAGIKIVSMEIYPSDQVIRVLYRWIDASGNAIHRAGAGGRLDHEWTGRNYNPTDCTGFRTPYSCCAGAGTGSGCEVWDNIFGYQIKAGAVGTSLGKGLRLLVLNQMKADIPELSGKSVTFTD